MIYYQVLQYHLMHKVAYITRKSNHMEVLAFLMQATANIQLS